MIEKMWETNPAGAGIAWRDVFNGEKVVRWMKGLDLNAIKAAIANTDPPFIAHFRIPSVGGHCKDLTHPFPITKDASLDLQGVTTGKVLFHNGHWNAWKTTLLEAVIKSPLRLPSGKWSDSRTMAILAHNFGLGILELIDEKVVVMGPEADDLDIFGIIGTTGWQKVDNIWVSNNHWNHTKYTNCMNQWHGQHGGHMQAPSRVIGDADATKQEAEKGGAAAPETFCGSMRALPSGQSVEQEAKGSSGKGGQVNGSLSANRRNAPEQKAVLSCDELLEMRRWACSINDTQIM